jgi:hypothetical protein
VRIFLIIFNLKTGSSGKVKFMSILEFQDELSLQNQENMTPAAPVIGSESRRIFYHANAEIPLFKALTVGDPGFTLLLLRRDFSPLGNTERNRLDLHSDLL